MVCLAMRNLTILFALLVAPAAAPATAPPRPSSGCPASFQVALGRWLTGSSTLYVAGDVVADPGWDYTLDRRISMSNKPDADLVVTLNPKRVRAGGLTQVVRPVFAAWLFHDHPTALTSSTAVRIECGGQPLTRITHEPQSVPTRAPPPMPPG